MRMGESLEPGCTGQFWSVRLGGLGRDHSASPAPFFLATLSSELKIWLITIKKERRNIQEVPSGYVMEYYGMHD